MREGSREEGGVVVGVVGCVGVGSSSRWWR